MTTPANICYRCGLHATTKEHVPPQCLFPEKKDSHGIDFRKNLITVPSCEEHNWKKSKDDEFLMVSLAGIIGNNVVGYIHTHTKVSRALKRKSVDFLFKSVIRNAKPIDIKLENGRIVPVWYGNSDNDRLIRCFEQIAYGLYFNETGNVFKGKIVVMLGFVNYQDENLNIYIKFLRRRFELEELLQLEKGDNREVFWYQFASPDNYGLIGIRMKFYQGADVFVSFIPENTEIPKNLAAESIWTGQPVTISLGKEEFRFNQ